MKPIENLWVRFLKEENIYILVFKLLTRLKPRLVLMQMTDDKIDKIDTTYIKYVVEDNHYDSFFQSTYTFCSWSTTANGHSYWKYISHSWRIYLYKNGYKVDLGRLQDAVQDFLYDEYHYKRKKILDEELHEILKKIK